LGAVLTSAALVCASSYEQPASAAGPRFSHDRRFSPRESFVRGVNTGTTNANSNGRKNSMRRGSVVIARPASKAAT